MRQSRHRMQPMATDILHRLTRGDADRILANPYGIYTTDARRRAAEELLRLGVNGPRPESMLAWRCLDLLASDIWDIPPRSPAGDTLAAAVEKLTRGLIYNPSRAVRLRCVDLVGQILAEASRLDAQEVAA